MLRNIAILIILFLFISCREDDTKVIAHNNQKNTSEVGKLQNWDIVIGNKDLKIVLIEYFSPTCPHCFIYHKNIYPEIKRKYIDTNKITYVIREFIGNKQDLDASILARCKDHYDSYIKFVNIILEKQRSWAFVKNYREMLINMSIFGGISKEKYNQCLNDKSLSQKILTNTKIIRNDPDFIGTPAFFINGKFIPMPYSVFELSKVIDSALEENG